MCLKHSCEKISNKVTKFISVKTGTSCDHLTWSKLFLDTHAISSLRVGKIAWRI